MLSSEFTEDLPNLDSLIFDIVVATVVVKPSDVVVVVIVVVVVKV